ncbi:hypothetical protein SKAU_G00342610 [Synaphobranchus kaupii]|uniref:Ubiquitin carboxyl-terminal hydrolase n=1 Tax=Synaphobranchus kaupii TaxID=118154 RepID=A0A9Q1IF84_SYNKA|nr:hypothetical protein SKAU_G00342610 [Synaphobranchus kaupii]
MADPSAEVIGEDLKSGLLVTHDPSREQAAMPTALAEEGSNPTQEDCGSKDPTGSASLVASAQEREDLAECGKESLPSQGEESIKGATDDGSVAPASEEEPTEEESPGVESKSEEESPGVESKSEERSQSADSASFSVPSLEFSDGNNGNSQDDALSSSYSALGAEGQSPSVDVPCLGDEALGAGAGAPAAAAAVGAPPGAGPDSDPALPAYYFVKWIVWKDKKTPIITQSENGPCPLLAIMNILFLRWQVRSRPRRCVQWPF